MNTNIRQAWERAVARNIIIEVRKMCVLFEYNARKYLEDYAIIGKLSLDNKYKISTSIFSELNPHVKSILNSQIKLINLHVIIIFYIFALSAATDMKKLVI